MGSEIADRIDKLEETVECQNAQINALTLIIGDLLAAHAVTQNDLRLISIVGENFRHNRSVFENGGTDRNTASYFGDRYNTFGEALESAHASTVLDRYWFQSFFKKREVKQRQKLENIRQHINRVLED